MDDQVMIEIEKEWVRPGLVPSAVEEKVMMFLRQFGSEEEFIGWCEVQGVKGIMGASSRCLVTQAVLQATGVPIATGIATWVQRAGEGLDRGEAAWMLPLDLLDVPRKFDSYAWPHLVEAPTCPS